MRIHVIGAAGYGAAEVIRLVQRHPHLELGALESATHAGDAIGMHVPLLRTLTHTFAAPGTVLQVAQANEIVVCAGSSGTARALVPELLARKVRVVDLSDDFRLHAHAGSAVYGLAERYADRIRTAHLIANPGCYPTASLLALLPLAPFAAEIVHIIIDAKSGITGAGRTPGLEKLFAEVDGDVRAYGLAGHRHEAEIAQELLAGGIDAPFTFTPHVVPLRRGMLADTYTVLRSPLDELRVRDAYKAYYSQNPFVRILEPTLSPSLPALTGTNDAEIHVSCKGNVVRSISAIDNLGKGAAGQALQNINLMLGYPEELGLYDNAIRIIR